MVLRYVTDARAPLAARLALPLALLYLLLPLDLLPDAVPVAGWVDDLAVLAGSWLLLLGRARRHEAGEKRRRDAARRVIEGRYRVLDG